MILWTLLACLESADLQPDEPGPMFDQAPVIQRIDWECDPDESEWSFEIQTENWTGGGWIWMGKSSSNAEAHRIKSVEAAADGSTDRLVLRLDIEADWRDANRGSSTRWLCSDVPNLTFLATVYNARSTDVEDCRVWGLDSTLWSRIESAHDCDEILELPESSDTGT